MAAPSHHRRAGAAYRAVWAAALVLAGSGCAGSAAQQPSSTPSTSDVGTSVVPSTTTLPVSLEVSTSLGTTTTLPAEPASGPAPVDDDVDGPTVLVIGDSSMAGLRWYEGVDEELTGARYLLDVESCRRVVEESCAGREGYVPPNVLEALAVAAETPVDVLVVMAGYNDDGRGFDEQVRFIGDVADDLGIEHKLWMRFTRPDPLNSMVDTRPHNEALDLIAGDATTRWTIVDWPTYAAQFPSVFESDRIHLTRSGAVELARFVSDVVTTMTDPSCRERPASSGCEVSAFVRLLP